MSSAVTLTGQELRELYGPIGNEDAYPELPGVVGEIIDRRLAGAPDALDRVKDLLYDWGQDFAEDEDVRMLDVLEDMWSAIAGMPEGTKVDALPSRAPVVCPHLREEQPAFAATWDSLWEELTRLRAARDRIRGVCDLAQQIASSVAGPPILAVDDVRTALGGGS
ncbi:hypothetical protein [Nocardioides panaciterrulae]|uniref:Uncharacterized protein n=1 Tax=Nocardioides panaciterrulae TaxID=661492 RepID=A0A7Y9J998_9ACTN|nr:hypothetical protein [Nocardioides panaciterrulae]NYD39936.1 hypothetical protein [Nocardioides panaciterrulae]NYD43968.1 hypothetical protein [Nocardioides panaciterrulae]